MLKSKKSLYLFLPLNIFLWGYIAYKIYTTFNEDEESAETELPVNAVTVKTEDSAAFVLSLNYEDPFLKNSQTKTSAAHIVKESPSPKVAAAPVKPAPPAKETKTEIKYFGLVHNKSKDVKTALISINGQSHIIKSGEMVNGLSFQEIDKDFIIVKDGKDKIVINR